MNGREKQAYVNEIKYQIKMLNNLKSWLRNLMGNFINSFTASFIRW